MSDYHVQNITTDGRRATVAFHIPVTATGRNSGNALWRTALSQFKMRVLPDGSFAPFQSVVPGLSAAHLTQLQNGEFLEIVDVVHFAALDTDPQKQAKVDAKYKDLVTNGTTDLQAQLKFWGFERNVP